MGKVVMDLPPGVIEADLKPSTNWKERLNTEPLVFHKVSNGKTTYWVIATLLIGRSNNSNADRTYAVRYPGGEVMRVGKGPHVKQTVTVYVKRGRIKALQPFIDLRETGLEKAGIIRDRISSRRAEGQMRRAQGERYWHWDN